MTVSAAEIASSSGRTWNLTAAESRPTYLSDLSLRKVVLQVLLSGSFSAQLVQMASLQKSCEFTGDALTFSCRRDVVENSFYDRVDQL